MIKLLTDFMISQSKLLSKARENAKRLEREEAERRVQEEVDRRVREEIERYKAREEAERRTKESKQYFEREELVCPHCLQLNNVISARKFHAICGRCKKSLVEPANKYDERKSENNKSHNFYTCSLCKEIIASDGTCSCSKRMNVHWKLPKNVKRWTDAIKKEKDAIREAEALSASQRKEREDRIRKEHRNKKFEICESCGIVINIYGFCKCNRM